MQDSLNSFERRVINFFDSVMSKVDKYSNKYKIEEYNFKFEVNESENFGINGAVSNKETITRDLILTVKLNTGTVNTYVIKVPIPINNLFVVRGNVRLNLNYLTNNEVVKITTNMLLIDGTSYLVINQRYNGDEIGMYVKERDEETKQWIHTKVDYISFEDRSPIIGKKLKVLFNLDDEPIGIDENLFNLIKSNYKLELRDNICNKEFLTTTGMFINHLENAKWEMIRTLQTKFYRYGNIAEYYMQTVVNRFFNLQSLTSVGIQTPNNINPITYNNLRSKIILSKGTDNGVAFSRMDISYTDFIDMVVTPDNKNVNRINELTSVIEITDEGTFIKCFDSDFNDIKVPFIDYISSRVLTSDQVDYDGKTINLGDEITYKLGGLRYTSKDKHFDYIEYPSDARLSKSVQMIPMLNHSDSVRGSMGARMLGQSIEVVGCEKPIVSSGHEKVSSDLSVTAPENGTIISIGKGVVTLKTNRIDENGDYISYTITKPDNLESMYGINISFSTRVKVGQIVEAGDLIFSPNSIADDSSFNFGINCTVAMMNYRGFTYEDGLVISESMARKFAHMSTIDVELVVDPTMKISGIKLPSDKMLVSGDSLCDFEVKLDKISNGINKTRIELLGETYYYKPVQLTVPLNINEAYLVDAKFIVGNIVSEDDETIHQVEGILGSNKGPIDPPVNYDYARLTLNDFDGEINCSYRIKFRLVVVNHLTKGDKITNRYGSKGIVSLIEKDSNLPRLEDGTPVDCVMNPAAVVSRKNMSQTMELYLSMFSDHIKNKCRSIIHNNLGTIDDVRNILNHFRYKNYAKLSDEDLVDLLESDTVFQIVTGTFSTITIEDIISWFKEENLEIGQKLTDGKTGRLIRKPVIVGKMYMMKLYHLAAKKAQVTVDHSLKPKFVLGIGKESQAGLKTGTMEMDALTANNLMSYIKYIDGNDTLKSSWFLAHCVLAGLGLKRDDTDELPEE